MKVCVSGLTGCRNRGVEALLRVVLDEFNALDGLERIFVITKTPDYDGNLIQGERYTYLMDPFRSVKGVTLEKAKLNSNFARSIVDEDYRLCSSAFNESDYLVVSGGDVFSSDYKDMHRHINLIRLAKSRGCTVILFGHSVGLFNDSDRRIFTKALRYIDYVFCRETASLRYMHEAFPDYKDVKLTADVAFLLKASDETAFPLAFIQEKFTPERYCCLVLSQGVTGFGEGYDDDAHFNSCASLISGLLRDLDKEISLVLIPHVQEVAFSNDDSILIDKISREFLKESRVIPLSAKLTAGEYKSIISKSEFVISERMHAAIAGLSQHVPVFTIGYSIKYEGIMQDCYGDVYTSVVTTTGDFVSAYQSVYGKIKCFIKSVEDLRVILRERVPAIKARARENFSLFRDFS